LAKKRKNRTPKPLETLIKSLDSHLFLIRRDIGNLGKTEASLKLITTELRTLICFSSGTEGLLWRLTEKLKISDLIKVVALNFDEDNHLFQKLHFSAAPVGRVINDPRAPSPVVISFKKYINECDAIAFESKLYSHEKLIKSLCQQMGSAHEDDGIEDFLLMAQSIKLNDREAYINSIRFAAELTLEVGQRVIDKALKNLGYLQNKHGDHNYGNISLVFSYPNTNLPVKNTTLFTWRSEVSNVTLTIQLSGNSIIFSFLKNGVEVSVLEHPINADKDYSYHVLSYCSASKQARSLCDGYAYPLEEITNLGWVFPADGYLEVNQELRDKGVFLVYNKLTSSDESSKLSKLPLNGYGLWKSSEEISRKGAFPD